MTSFRPYVLVLSFSVLAFLLAGCGSSDRSPALGDWIVQEDGLTLTQDLHVSETDTFYFGSIAGRNVTSSGPGLDVTSDGRMVVADPEAQELKVLHPDGTLAHRLGRPGEGPGEFRNLSSVQVARGDSIYAYGGRRLTVFAPGPPHEVARTVTVASDRIPPFQVLVTAAGFAALYGTPLMSGGGLNDAPRAPWRRVDEAGAPGDTLFMTRLRRMASVRLENGHVAMRQVPFEQNMPVAPGSEGRLYVGCTDSVHVTAYDLDGRSKVIASIPAPSVPVRAADRDSALVGMDNSELLNRIKSAIPTSKPAITDLVVADDGTLWVQRPADGPNAETVPWWVLDPEAKTIREVHLPPEVNIEVVQDGKVYGTTTTGDGAPAVVRHEIRTES